MISWLTKLIFNICHVKFQPNGNYSILCFQVNIWRMYFCQALSKLWSDCVCLTSWVQHWSKRCILYMQDLRNLSWLNRYQKNATKSVFQICYGIFIRISLLNFYLKQESKTLFKNPQTLNKFPLLHSTYFSKFINVYPTQKCCT